MFHIKYIFGSGPQFCCLVNNVLYCIECSFIAFIPGAWVIQGMRHRVLPTNFTPHTAQAPAVQAGSFTVKEKHAILYMQLTRATSLKAIKNKLSSKN